MLGFDKSYVQKFQSEYKPDDENYDDELKLIEYDMLYGKRYMYPDGWPYEPTDMQYGIEPILITGVEKGTYIVPDETALVDDGSGTSSGEASDTAAKDISQNGSSGASTESSETDKEILEGYYIRGENFNECTFAWIDGAFDSNTIYIDRNTLFLPHDSFEPGKEISIAQVGDDGIDFGVEDT